METIKGKWMWNEALPTTRLYQIINFTSNGMPFVRMDIYYTGAGCDMVYEKANEDIVFVGVSTTNNEPLTFNSAAYRLIDFGETEQEVSEEFYNYLIANATPVVVTIADKLTQIAENEPKVYEAGIEKGKQAEYDAFWDAYQKNGNRRYYDNAFYDSGNEGGRWTYNVTYKPKYPIKPTSAICMYAYSILPYEAIAAVDFSECRDFGNTFMYYMGDAKIPPIDLRAATRTQTMFGWSSKIQEIEELWVAESTPYQTAFSGCSNLTEVRFKGTIGQSGLDFKSCTQLSKESIESVIKCLSSTTTGLTVTFSKAAVDKAYETSEGANNGSDTSTWFDDQVGYKPDWTIALA